MRKQSTYKPYKALRARDQLVSALAGAYRYAREQCWSADRLSGYCNTWIFNTEPYTRLPVHCKEFVRGYRDALQDYHWNHVVEWRVLFESVLVPGSHVPEGQWYRVKDGAHVYKHAPQCLYTVPSSWLPMVIDNRGASNDCK